MLSCCWVDGEPKQRHGDGGWQSMAECDSWLRAFLALPIIVASGPLLRMLLKRPCTLDALSTAVSAHHGHLADVVRVLTSLGWVHECHSLLRTTSNAVAAAEAPLLKQLCADVHAGGDVTLLTLTPWLQAAAEGWLELPADAAALPHMRWLLSGALLVPLLLHLRAYATSMLHDDIDIVSALPGVKAALAVKAFLTSEGLICSQGRSRVRHVSLAKLIYHATEQCGMCEAAAHSPELLCLETILFGDVGSLAPHVANELSFAQMFDSVDSVCSRSSTDDAGPVLSALSSPYSLLQAPPNLSSLVLCPSTIVAAIFADCHVHESRARVQLLRAASSVVEHFVCSVVRGALHRAGMSSAAIAKCAHQESHADAFPHFSAGHRQWLKHLCMNVVSARCGELASPPTFSDLCSHPALQGYSIELGIIERCSHVFDAVLQQTSSSLILQTLFAADPQVMRSWYAEGVTFAFVNAAAKSALRSILRTSGALQNQHQLQILELGGGTAGLTVHLLDELHAGPAKFMYKFSDISQTFLAEAQAMFAGDPFVVYAKIDASKPLIVQGIAPASLDIVVASNVLHDARLPDAVVHIYDVLRPGGVLLAVELTSPTTWWHMCFGPLMGMWKFVEDASDMRLDRFWLSRTEWTQLLSELGFVQVVTLGDDEPEFENTVLIAQVPVISRTAASASVHVRDLCTTNEGVGQQNRSTIRIDRAAAARMPPCAKCVNLFDVLQAAGNTVLQIPGRRWALTCGGAPAVRHGAFVAGIERFDSAFFAISQAEAQRMDPQQRLLLEVGYASLHRADKRKGSLCSAEVGVFLGIMNADFAALHENDTSVYAATGGTISIAAGRLSFVLGVQGPCISCDTACSSALVALHSASITVIARECLQALTIAVNLMLVPRLHHVYARAGMLASHGRCKTFDNLANGFVRSEGLGALTLFSASGTSLLGSRVHSDGKSASLTAPNGLAQARLISVVLAAAGVHDLCILEAHGTGTPLGDPVELGGLKRVLGQGESFLGGVKASLGHIEAFAGLAGLFALVQKDRQSTCASNAHLRELNPLLAPPLQTFRVPTQSVLLSTTGAAGVSSFGYSGTISHAALKHPVEEWSSCSDHHLPSPLFYRRRSFLWREMDASSDAVCTGVYSLGLAKWSPSAFVSLAPTMLIALSTTRYGSHTLHSFSRQGPFFFLVLLDADAGAAPSMSGSRLALALVQGLVSLSLSALRVSLFSCGAAPLAAFDCGPTASNAAHGGAWGFVRVLRVEYPALQTQSADVTTGTYGFAHQALMPLISEAEVAWRTTGSFAARLRAHATAFTQSKLALLAQGTHAITGGLGGLGMRAAAMLNERGAPAVLLTSRSGRAARDAQGLGLQLQSISTVAAVVMCDSADVHDTYAMVSAGALVGMLHAAGLHGKGLLAELQAWQLQRVHASKATGSWHLQFHLTAVAMETSVLFSSVGSGLGNVGQANYAAANACLDAHAMTQRAKGVRGCSAQWPLVGGAGIGAAVYGARAEASVTIAGLASITLEDYTEQLRALLATRAAVCVQMVHLSDVHELLQDLADPSQSRFDELVATVTQADLLLQAGGAPSEADSALLLNLGSLARVQSQQLTETAVLRVVHDFTGAPYNVLTADTPLMEAGVDSLAATEVAARLRMLTGVILPPTLVFEQPTPRAVAAHLLVQLACEMDGATASSSQKNSGPQLGLIDSGINLCGGADYGTRCTPGSVACSDTLSRRLQTQWAVVGAAEVCTLSANIRALAIHDGFEAERIDTRAIGVVLSTLDGELPNARASLRGAELAGWGVVAESSQDAACHSRFAYRSRPLLLSYCRLTFRWSDLAHPLAQRGVLSSEGSTTLRSPSTGALRALVADHVVQQRIIFPGAGYLEMARAAAKAMALHGVYFLQPLAIEATALSIECTVVDGRFEVRSGGADATTSTTVHCSGVSSDVNVWRRVDHASLRVYSRAADVGFLYDGFYAVGLHYGPGYRTLVQVWGSANTALAKLHERSTTEGTQVHPADLDDALCTSAAMAPSGDSETRLPFAVDVARLHGAPGKLWAVRLRLRPRCKRDSMAHTT